MRAVTGGNGRYWAVLGCLAVTALTARYRPLPSIAAQSHDILLATTTSTRDAGLLDSLLPVFERQTHYTVKVIAVGSGQALAMGRRGDADVVLSHAPEAERALVDSGYFVGRRIVMHNEFLIVGPARDPAGLRGLSDPVAAFRKVAERRGIFVSRGDQSGTHQREQLLWKRAGFQSSCSRWCVPDWSPRETKMPRRSATLRNAATGSLRPRSPAGSRAGPTMRNSLCITMRRPTK